MPTRRLLYGRPDESILRSDVVGTVDSEYTDDDLVSGDPWVPVRRTGAASFAVSIASTAITPSASRTIGLYALLNHNVPAGTAVNVGGQAPTSLTVPAWGYDGIPYQPFSAIASVTTVTSITVSVASVANPTVIGEFWASTLRSLPKQLRVPFDWDRSQPFAWEGAPPLDAGAADPWRIAGTMLLTITQLADVRAWYESTRRGTLPTLIVQDETVNDARLVKFQYRPRPVYVDKFEVSFEFVEVLPRLRW